MAKAQIKTTDGIIVKLEGTPAEIAAVVKEVKTKLEAGASRTAKSKATSGRITITTLVDGLKTEGFFKKPKTLGDIKKRLADLGHTYPLTGLSGPMRKQVRKKSLRRFKENGKYVYAQ
jgi:hypothetical protein